MEIVVGVVVLILVGWALTRNRPGTSAASPTRRQESRGRKAPRSRLRQDPVAPHPLPGAPSRLGARGRVSVVGEFYRQDGIGFVVGGRVVADGGNWDEALEAEAALVPEPDNPHDRNAVRVDLCTPRGWVTAGYIAREQAVEYQPRLLRMARAGQLPTTEARICRARGGPLAVYLHLSDADSCVLANPPRVGVVVLGSERSCAVTGENKHQDVLEPLAPRTTDGRTHMWATVHPSTVTNGKYAGQPTLEVRLDGLRVGSLTATQAARYMDAVGAEGAACQVAISRGAKQIEVQVFLPRLA